MAKPSKIPENDAGAAEASAQTCITAIIPARNEEAAIEACVRSLARQADIAEIVVVDDQSTDMTAQIVERLMTECPRLRLLTIREVPPGWSGKNNALWFGASGVNNPWLLFTDADAELELEAASNALQIASETGAVLVSFSPEQITENWYEKSLIPFVYARLAKHFSFDEINDSAKTAAAANGQFLMIRRAVYEAIGGHASVAGEVLEDVALAARAKAAGYRLWFGSGAGVVRVRMYRSFRSMWEGWRKNLYMLIGGTPRSVFSELSHIFPWPECLLFIAGFWFLPLTIAAIALLLLRHFAYGIALASNQRRADFILHYMPGVLLYTGVLWASYRAHKSGTVKWKGRAISVGIARPERPEIQ